MAMVVVLVVQELLELVMCHISQVNSQGATYRQQKWLNLEIVENIDIHTHTQIFLVYK